MGYLGSHDKLKILTISYESKVNVTKMLLINMNCMFHLLYGWEESKKMTFNKGHLGYNTIINYYGRLTTSWCFRGQLGGHNFVHVDLKSS